MSAFSKVFSIIINPYVLATTSTILVAIGVYKAYQMCCGKKNKGPVTTAFNPTLEDLMAGVGVSDRNLQANITSQMSSAFVQLGEDFETIPNRVRADEEESGRFLGFATSFLRRRTNTVGTNVAEAPAERVERSF